MPNFEAHTKDRIGQLVSIIGTNVQNILLPLALDWSLIEFDGLEATASDVQVVLKIMTVNRVNGQLSHLL
jgi:hypothetical protein